jgi:SNF2 family DNA or RNA helicase
MQLVITISRMVILTGETGLDHTMHVITFLHSIFGNNHFCGLFLVIASLPKLLHWQRPFQECTDFKAIVYMGNQKALDILGLYEFYSRTVGVLTSLLSSHRTAF